MQYKDTNIQFSGAAQRRAERAAEARFEGWTFTTLAALDAQVKAARERKQAMFAKIAAGGYQHNSLSAPWE